MNKRVDMSHIYSLPERATDHKEVYK
jgi:hypothetical protein